MLYSADPLFSLLPAESLFEPSLTARLTLDYLSGDPDSGNAAEADTSHHPLVDAAIDSATSPFAELLTNPLTNPPTNPLTDIAVPGQAAITPANSPQPLDADIDFTQIDSIVPETIDFHMPLEVVFLDAAVSESEELAAGLQEKSKATQWLFYRLENTSNGIEQIDEILSQLDSVDAVHLLGHGDDTGLQLGNQFLTATNAEQFTDQLANWGQALASDADLLLYSCDLASSASGQALINLIARSTLSDVAASADRTGHADLGGDWVLEYQVGEIETDVLVSKTAQQSWMHTLDISTDLVGHYAFDENGGSTLIDSAGNQDGTFGNGALRTTGSTVGSYAIDFSLDGAGANASVLIPDNPAQDFGANDWTVTSGISSAAIPLLMPI